ncbi:MAG: sporulation protein YtfJ [Clostridia bacterium]|nr:sporulation protein YtfJ [Clostridia bacterium]MBR3909382.1 sporulation protein YtfJ [Clostridia bacterium]
MSKERANNKIRELMATAMKDLNSLVDVNTVIGKPVKVDQFTSVIPITKVTMGFMTGGGEYGEVKAIKNDKSLPFAGGSGAVVSLKPSGFLVERANGVQLLSVADDAFSRLIESVDNFIKSFKNEENS